MIAKILEANPPVVHHGQSKSELINMPLQLAANLRRRDFGHCAGETGGLMSGRLRLDCMETPPCIVFV